MFWDRPYLGLVRKAENSDYESKKMVLLRVQSQANVQVMVLSYHHDNVLKMILQNLKDVCKLWKIGENIKKLFWSAKYLTFASGGTEKIGIYISGIKKV